MLSTIGANILSCGKYHCKHFAVATLHVGRGNGFYNKTPTYEFAGLWQGDRNWNFGLLSEIVQCVDRSLYTDFFLSANYNTYFKSKDIDAQNYVAFQVGLRFVP